LSLRPLFIALSGGGSHAAAHAGALKVLATAGIPISGMAGVSGGALVAAAFAGGADMDKLVEQATGLHPWMWVRGWGGGLLSGSRLGALIDEYLPIPAFADLHIPVAVLATDVDTSEPVVVREGNVRDAVRATCSYPGVFPPMVLEGRRLYDGGVSAVVPVKVAREMAGETGFVLALDCNSGSRWPAADSFVAVALRAGLSVLRGRTRNELAGADLVIAPQIGESGWMRPAKIPKFYAAGMRAMEQALPELRRLLDA
jgi:NTE family protein